MYYRFDGSDSGKWLLKLVVQQLLVVLTIYPAGHGLWGSDSSFI